MTAAKVIHKHRIEMDPGALFFQMSLPIDAVILSVAFQGHHLCFWEQHSREAENTNPQGATFKFATVMTGEERADLGGMTFLGTAHRQDMRFVVHVYCRTWRPVVGNMSP